MKQYWRLGLALMVFSLLSAGGVGRAEAFDIRSGESVVVEVGEVVGESILAAGERVDILGTVEGDVICAGQNVRVSGEVKGDVICAGQNIEISGVVEGDVRVAGQWVRIEGVVGKNITVFGQNVDNRAMTGGEMMAAGQNIEVGEVVGGGLLAAGESVNVDGEVGGNARMWVNRLRLGNESRIGGDLWYESENELSMTGGRVGGRVERVSPPEERSGRVGEEWKGKMGKLGRGVKGVSSLGSWLVSLVLGLIMVGLWPKQVGEVTARMRRRWSAAMLVGLGGLVLVPMLVVLMMVTIVGIPFALSLAVLFVIALMVAPVWAGLALGDELMGRYSPESKDNRWLAAALGISVLAVLMAIPMIGWIAKLVAVLWGMGGWWYLLRKEKKAKK